MNVLGIETSCDETSVAVVKDGRKILSCEVSSSLQIHKLYGGVIPEIASRAQLETISGVAGQALKNAKVRLKDIGLIAVTTEPGLPGSLLVGVAFARAVSLACGIRLINVDHVLSHIYANFLDGAGVKIPFIALVVSGGHTNLYMVKSFADIKALGRSQDDACGEAFDKTAKILGLGYPGGPAIEKASLRGNAKSIKFKCCGTSNPLDFSFSGIKTAVLYYTNKHVSRTTNDPSTWFDFAHHRSLGVNGRRTTNDGIRTTICDIAASFQESVIGALVSKSVLACASHKIKRLVIGGGVACNERLREKFRLECRCRGIDVSFPAKSLCTDNAAMVAGLGYCLYKTGG
ncbi:MAG: tRNA (adenosine(37)-N6)-threonylcarbamoyltransferase complex transferase subunit TsaD [Candidatus Omnitrophota bacterium]|nr:tRNA (adenosine(37)-N6)-threonylcarbamoyltransferase complex transferase subunit TsaD [Candidatus Omnitrophota bacterium]